MRYKFYTTSDKAWDGIMAAINQAQKSIYIEMYIFLGDTQQTHDFLGQLKAKALLGLEVVMVLDAYGSSELKASSIQDLRSAGVELLFFSRWLRRTHRKLVIIDSKIAFIGGVNIENKIRNWQDLHLRLGGKIIKPLLRSFAYTYQQCGGKNNNILKQSRLPLVKKIKSWVIDTWEIGDKKYRLNNYYLKKLIEAKTSIKIITPYLLPPRRLMQALDDAVRRGVKVKIIIPEDTDIKVLNKINYFNACRLALVGVEFYFTPNMNHAKVMLIDEREALVGSQNLDVLSFGFNAEIGVFFQQKQAIATLIKIINKWEAQARKPELSFRRLSFVQRILMSIFKIFLSFF
ncbi:phosphatidylserine/phosphatidylglycerophosphate/cardiolipin synthase family protein [Patescibacteria group bacterium]|nr:phosphatidylserine/phosphatidylglycerophosphate/cardiolipin synthase family protein [Patescibacteria group bacterium]